MILIEEISRDWKRDGDWRIAPAGLAWIAEGHRIIVGGYASIGDGTRIGDGTCIVDYARIGSGASIGDGTRIGDGTCIGNNTSIGTGTHIGNNTSIGDGVDIDINTYIGSCVRIDNGTRIGSYARIGSGVRIGSYAHISTRIGDGASIGDRASEAIDLGFADGYRKCLANVKGVAYIGAGCRWFTLAEAIKHWESHDKNRDLTLCLMQSAIHIAGLKGWAFSEAEN